jgi:TPR repeat protein
MGWQDASPAAAAAPPPPPPPDALQNVGQPELVKRAKAGDIPAQIELGKRYMQGTNNTTTDPSEALRWLLMAAEAGDAQAQFNVGVMYERGIGATADLAKAAQWYRKAADRPIPEPTALHNLALLYIKGGGGIAADPAQARALMTRAAEMGQAQSQYSLALMYFQGVGGASDPVTALSWVALAARTNNPQYVQAAQELAGALNAEQKNKAQQLANQHVTRINETIARLRTLAGNGAPGIPAAAPSPAPAASPPMPVTTPDKSSTADAADQPLDHAGIAQMQKLLIQLKFYSGAVDGKSGPKTAQAIREYQKMAGLPVDGKATAGLLGSLRDVAGAVTSH